MSSPFAGQPILLDLPRPFAGYPRASVENIDALGRVIHFRLADASGQPRAELNTARFDGTFTPEAIAADIVNDLEAHA